MTKESHTKGAFHKKMAVDFLGVLRRLCDLSVPGGKV